MVRLNIDLPEGFLEEEERCGYVVTTEMKQVWAVMLDLLAEIDRVCKKYQIKYFGSSGTILGAVRHKGFIPWDDDIDIMMLRSEYDKLCKVAEKEFKHPYFFQTEWTDRGSLRGHAQLRNSMTTGILTVEFEQRFSFNQGIFIDIFPLDSIPDDQEMFSRMIVKSKKLKHQYLRLASLKERFFQPSHKNAKYYIKAALHRLIPNKRNSIWDYDVYYKRFEELCCSCKDDNTKLLGILGLDFSNKNLRYYRVDMQEYIMVPFEFLTIPIPKNYDHVLRTVYGDYQKYIKGGSIHGGLILDATHPYTDYFEKGQYCCYNSELYYHE